MIELLAVGNQIFEVAIFNEGIGIAQRYKTQDDEKRTKKAVIFWHCLFAHKLSPAFEMRNMGFDVKHPIKFNRAFREWISKQTISPELDKEIKVILLLIKAERKIRKFENAFKRFPSLFHDNEIRHNYVKYRRLRDRLTY